MQRDPEPFTLGWSVIPCDQPTAEYLSFWRDLLAPLRTPEEPPTPPAEPPEEAQEGGEQDAP